MSLELANTLATFATFLVIAATAIAAIVQLRHARSSNQIAALNELSEKVQTSEFQAADHFIQTHLAEKLRDPAFRHQSIVPSATTDEVRPILTMVRIVGNYYERMGVFVKTGLVDRELAMQMWAGTIIRTWEALETYAALLRRTRGDGLWENFEFLTVLAQDWMAEHSRGTYPVGIRRIKLKDEWLDADTQYAASRTAAS